MRLAVAELVEVAYQYHPRGIWPSDARYDEAPEHRRLVARRREAARDRERWLAMLERVRARLPGIEVRDDSVRLFSGNFDVSYSGQLHLPASGPRERSRSLEFRVSLLVPCYVVHRSRFVYTGDIARGRLGDEVEAYRDVRQETGFDFAPDERGPAGVLAEEIEASFGYEPMPPEVGHVVVPDVATASRAFGEATIYHCLVTEEDPDPGR